MRSRFFQLRCHQPHSTLTFSQTEFAFYLDPFALVPVILSLVPILALFGPSQSWPGKPDSPRFAVAEILTVPVYLICQYPTGVVSLALVEIFNHFLELGRFVVSIKRTVFQPCPAVCDTDIQLHAKLHGFADLSPHYRAHKGLADADYSVLNAVGMVVIHVLLLLINLTNRLQSLRLVNIQCLFLIQLPVNGSKVSFQIVQLLPNGFTGHLCGVFAAADILQIVFPGSFAIGTGLLAVGGAVENIQQLLSIFSGFIQKGNILGIPDIGRCAGGIHDYRAAVPSTIGLVIILVIVIFCFLCFLDDHFIDLSQNFRRQAFSEMHHRGRIEGQFAVVIARIPTEILQIWVLLDLQNSFHIGIPVFPLDETSTQRQLKRLGHIPGLGRKQIRVLFLNLVPWDALRFLHPAVVFPQAHTHGLLKI